MDMTIELQDIAKMIDHAVLHPTQTEADVIDASTIALKYNIASLCVKPCHVDLACDLLTESDVLLSTVIGFPHGGQTTETKLYESQRAVGQGAVELDMVVNISKVLEGDDQYIQKEISQINSFAKDNNALLKVIFETDFLNNEQIIFLCKLCNETEVAFVKTSTGFGYNKQASGDYNYTGATIEDILLMKQHVNQGINLKASGGIRTLSDLLKYKELGVTRIGTSSTVQILTEIG